jgi:membrane-associated protease RseP (regulator of RpoE activity)
MTDLLRPPAPTPESDPHQQVPIDRGNPVRLLILGGLLVLAGLRGGWSLLVMILALVVMIFLHELGHFVTAKRAGMKVTEFFIGFGPRIWSFQRGETEYGLKVLPFGAYVKIIGMHNLDEFDPADADRTYMSKPFWRRLSVAVAGSTMHFILALACLFVAFAWAGVPGGSFSPDDRDWVARGIEADSPAGEAGIQDGDAIVSVDGVPVNSFESFTETVRDRPGETVVVIVERDSDEVSLTAQLADAHPDTGAEVGYLGVGPTYPEVTVGPVAAVGRSVGTFGEAVGETLKGIATIFSPSGLADLGERVFAAGDQGEGGETAGGGTSGSSSSSASDDASRPVSIVGITQIGSDILGEDAAQFFILFAIVNIFIGVFNLVPLLPLDGGHVAIAVYEKVRSTLNGGRPYHVDVVKLLPLTYAVVLVMAFLGLSTIYLDIVDPVGG